MKRDHTHTLLLPFEQGILDAPQTGQSWLFLNAEVLPDISLTSVLKCEQPGRSSFLALERAGYSVVTNFQGDQFEGGLVITGRNRKVNEANIIKAHNAVSPDGWILVAGDKTSGIQSLRKRFKDLSPESLSKNHAVVFWFKPGAEAIVQPDLTIELEGYHLADGMFSAKNIDKGSELLAEHFDDRLFGKVADFGAGWGYLSAELFQRSERVESVDLFEADYRALEAARQNVPTKATFNWADLTTEAPRGPYDWIIMNPPFHTGRAAEPKLGVTFIEAAAKALPSGGRLLMVANTNLPYEQTLDRLFKEVEHREQAGGFKVIEAMR